MVVVEMSQLLHNLFTSIREKQKLTNEEFKSLKNTIFSRIGYGLKFTELYSQLPSAAFMLIFYILSPFYLKSIYNLASTAYHAFDRLRFVLFFKGEKID